MVGEGRCYNYIYIHSTRANSFRRDAAILKTYKHSQRTCFQSARNHDDHELWVHSSIKQLVKLFYRNAHSTLDALHYVQYLKLVYWLRTLKNDNGISRNDIAVCLPWKNMKSCFCRDSSEWIGPNTEGQSFRLSVPPCSRGVGRSYSTENTILKNNHQYYPYLILTTMFHGTWSIFVTTHFPDLWKCHLVILAFEHILL